MILQRVGIEKMVDAVADGNDLMRSKPEPEVFLIAAQRLGLKPEECLVVEDAPAGIEAGRRAGMAVFGIGLSANLPGVKHIAAHLADVGVDELLSAGT